MADCGIRRESRGWGSSPTETRAKHPSNRIGASLKSSAVHVACWKDCLVPKKFAARSSQSERTEKEAKSAKTVGSRLVSRGIRDYQFKRGNKVKRSVKSLRGLAP
jgi:hypothetical protein